MTSSLLSGAFAALVMDPHRDRLYISNGSSGTVIVWNTTSDTEMATISTGAQPTNLAVSFNDTELYVTLPGAHALGVVDLEALTLSRTIPLSAAPADVAAGRPGRAYVTTWEYWGFPRIVDTINDKEIGNISAAGSIYQGAGIRISRDRSTVFIGEMGLSPASMYAFSVVTDDVFLNGAAPFGTVGDNLLDFAVSLGGDRLYIATGWPYYIQIVNPGNWTHVGVLNTGPYPSGISLAQRDRLAFAAHATSDVVAFNTSSRASVGSYTFSQDVMKIVALPDGSAVYAITWDIYGSNRRLEKVSTGLSRPPAEPPLVTVVSDVTFGYLPLPVTFFTDVLSTSGPFNYSWTFGDGGRSFVPNPTHGYATRGTFAVSIGVTDARGQRGNASLNITTALPLPPNLLAAAQAYDGLHFDPYSNFWVPPDVQIATGPDHVIEMVNDLVAIHTREGSLVWQRDLQTFFGVPRFEYLSDPKILYDALSRRWFASIADMLSGRILLAVSNSSDPMAGWRVESFSAITPCADQPLLGLSDDVVVLSANDFSSCFGNPDYAGAEILVVNKTDLIGGATARYATLGVNASLRSVYPVPSLSSTETQFMVSVGWGLTQTNVLQVFSLTGAPPGSVTVVEKDVPMRAALRPPQAVQPLTTMTLNTDDARVLDAFWDRGNLWLTFGERCRPEGEVRDRSCFRIIQATTPTGTLLRDFTTGSRGKDYFYPAIRTDSRGNLAAVFGVSSAQDYPGILVGVLGTNDSESILRAPLVLSNGTGIDPSACDAASCRYGDYFGAARDPADPTLVWVAGEYGNASGWRTEVASVAIFENANLTVSYSGPSGGSYAPPILTFFSNGNRRSVALTGTETTYGADPGSEWSITNPLVGSSAGERWFTDAVTSGVVDSPSVRMNLNYRHEYYVGVATNSSRGGSVSFSPGWHLAASVLAISAAELPGWRFIGWRGSGPGSYTGTENPVTLSIEGPITEEAIFYAGLSISVTQGGSVSFFYANVTGRVLPSSNETIFVPAGTEVKLLETPSGLYRFDTWTGSVVGPGSFVSIRVDSPVAVAASFSAGPQPLAAALSASPVSGQAPLNVSFACSGTGGTPPYSFEWNFGDGSPTGPVGGLVHAYTKAGAFIATCTVTDSLGERVAKDMLITITSASPSGIGLLGLGENLFTLFIVVAVAILVSVAVAYARRRKQRGSSPGR